MDKSSKNSQMTAKPWSKMGEPFFKLKNDAF